MSRGSGRGPGAGDRRHPEETHETVVTVPTEGLPVGRDRGLLRTYLWWVVATSMLTVVVVALAVGHRPVQYTYSANVLVDSVPTRAGLLEPVMGNEKQVAESGQVAAIVEDRLGIDDPDEVAALRGGLGVSAMVDTTVLRIDYTSLDERDAYNRAFVFSEAYIDYRNKQQPQRVATLISSPQLTGRGTGESVVVLGLVGLMVGAGLGLALAWVWDRVTDRLRGSADLERHSGLPVFARVPYLGGDLDLPWSGPRTRQAFAHLAARVLGHLGNPRHGVVVLVAGARGHTGSSTVAFELAASLSGLGRRTVVVDADDHEAGLAWRLDHGQDAGLGDVLASRSHVDSVVVPTPVERVSLVPSGTVPVTGGELDVDALGDALSRLAARAIVVVDGPPLLEDAGSLVLVGRADVVLLVADERAGTRTDARAAVALLQQHRDHLLGWVVNRPARRRRVRLPGWGRGVTPPATSYESDGLVPGLDPEPDIEPDSGPDTGERSETPSSART